MPTITAAGITNAIASGHTDIDAIAKQLGVPHTSYNLRARIALLANSGTIVVARVAADGTKTFALAA